MPNVARVRRTRTLPLALTLGLALCVGALTLAPAISADAVPSTPQTLTTASTMDCVPTPVWSYTWNAAASTGTVTATGGYPGQPVCAPLSIRAVSWMYDAPLNGSWPQTLAAQNDFTINSIGTFPFASPGVSCGQDDVYATFSTSGFDALPVGPVLTGPGAPHEPPFLHQAIAGVGGKGTGGSTWHTDPTAGCIATVDVVKKAVSTTGDTPVTETSPAGTFDYTIDVHNSGHIAAAGVVVSDTVPASLAITGPVVAPGWACTTVEQVINCTLSGQLAGGASAGTIRVPVQLAETATEPNVANTATLCGTNIGPCVSSQSVVVITPVPPVEPPVPPVEPPVVPPVNPPVQPPAALSDLEVQKTASLTKVQLGGAFTYSITASNPGADTTQDVVVTDTLDSRLRLTTTPSGSGWACTVITPGYGASFECELPYGLAAGASKTISVPVEVNAVADATTKPFIDNTAEACGTDVDCVSSTARVTLVSDQLPTLALPEGPTTPTGLSPANGDLPTLALHDAALAHTGVDAAGTTMISIGALVLGLGLTVIAAGRRRQRQS